MLDRLNHKEVQERLDSLFVGDEMKNPLQVRAHLERCDQCRAYFEELSGLDNAFAAEGEEPGPDSFMARYSAAIVEASIQKQEEPVQPWTETLAAWWHRFFSPARGALALGAMACVAMAMGSQWYYASQDSKDEWTSRAANAAPDMDPERAGVWHLEAFCVEHGTDGPAFKRAESNETLRCNLDDELKFAFINQTTQSYPTPYLSIFSLSPEGKIRWYTPLPEHSEHSPSMLVEEAPRLAPLGETIRLNVRHQAEDATIYGLFTAMPVDRQGLEEAMQNHQHKEGLPSFKGLQSARNKNQILGTGPAGDYVLRSLRLSLVAEE